MVTTMLSFAIAAACTQPDLDHRAWTRFLGRYVEGGLVDYAAVKGRGLADLEAYVSALDAICPEAYAKLAPGDQLAFLLNAYNAHVVRLVAGAYPIASIRDVTEPFKRPIVPLRVLGASPISLDALENELIRKRFGEPRVHFALVCAAMDCPPLRKEAYLGRKIEQQLEEQARLFVGDRRKNRFDADAKVLELSAIFDWFHGDFEKAGSVPTFVAKYLGDGVAAPGVVVRFRDYDWTLNDAKRGRGPGPLETSSSDGIEPAPSNRRGKP